MPLILDKLCSFHPTMPRSRRGRKVPFPVFLPLNGAAFPGTCLGGNEQVRNNCERCKVIYMRAGIVMLIYVANIARLSQPVSLLESRWGFTILLNTGLQAITIGQSESASKTKPLSSLHNGLCPYKIKHKLGGSEFPGLGNYSI